MALPPPTLSAPRLLALDLGAKRIGVAVSDHAGMMAHPHSTLEARGLTQDAERILQLCADLEAGGVVLGLPAHADGTESSSARRSRKYASVLTARGVAVDFEDEWGSSLDAHEVLREQGRNARGAKGLVDRLAAASILQSYLNRRAAARRAMQPG